MGFFNFGTKTTAATTETNTRPIILQFNEEEITVSAQDAAGKTVGELFEEFASDLGDVDRVNRYVAAGQVISASTGAAPGTVYRAAITSESKGIN